MKKLSLQKNFLQKLSLLLVVFLGGCNLEFRDKFDIPAPTPTAPTFIEYFDEMVTYGGVNNNIYSYNVNGEALCIVANSIEYTYDDNCDVDGDILTGTFTSSKMGETLTGTVDTVTGDISITDIPFIDNFVNNTVYGDYIYYSSSKSFRHRKEGYSYTYQKDSSTADTGIFYSTMIYATLVVTIDDEGVIVFSI